MNFNLSNIPDRNQKPRTSGLTMVIPAVNLEYALTQFILVRAGGGYAIPLIKGSWDDTEGTEIRDVPDISPKGPMLQLGLFVGLFQQ